MYRMYGQIFAPAISALPPSVVVVCRGAMDGKERRMPMGRRYCNTDDGYRDLNTNIPCWGIISVDDFMLE